jgi:hypothetical protein
MTWAPLAHASTFGPGEQMVIKVQFLGVKAGIATITVGMPDKQNGRDAWPVVVTADTQSLFAIFPLHDKFVSWFDPAYARSVAYDFYALEAGKPRTERARFSTPEPGKVSILRAKPGEAPATTVYDSDPLAQDIAGGFYTVRTFPLVPNTDLTVPVFTGKHSWNMLVHVNPPQSLVVAAGTFQALPLDIEVHFDGKLETKRRITMWVSDDARHVILKAEAELALGSLTAELLEYHPGNDVHGLK